MESFKYNSEENYIEIIQRLVKAIVILLFIIVVLLVFIASRSSDPPKVIPQKMAAPKMDSSAHKKTTAIATVFILNAEMKENYYHLFT